MRKQATPLTPLGGSLVGIAAFGFTIGWTFGWIELIVLATACSIALILALPFVLGRVQVEASRQLRRDRVVVGDRAHVTFTFTNPRPTRSRRRELRDLAHSLSSSWRGEHRVEIPSMAGGETSSVGYDLPPLQRGCYDVGPAVISRSDPLQLLRRDVAHTGADVLWIHPNYEPVRALPVGFAKDLEGPTSDTSPVGDVAFHSLREYATGDDFRHIHWMSTARTGRPMVRHYVDNRRPHLAVLLDTASSRVTSDVFEVGVEIAASLAVSASMHREPLTMWTSQTIIAGVGHSPERDAVLDALSLVALGANKSLTESAAEMMRSERGISAVAIITGGCPARELLDVTNQIRRRARPIVVRVWPTARIERDSVPHVQVIDVDSRDGFAAAWGEVMR